jgi:uncharacterized protein GlcG (DUF336 family)
MKTRRPVAGALLAALVPAVLAGPASGPAAPSLDAALRAVHAAVLECKKDGYAVSAAVVSAEGVLRAMARADGAGPHTVDSSTRKAYTAASLKVPTQELATLIARKPQVQGLRDMNERILILGGGLPIRSGETVVGGIGVGGAPGAHLDEACARAGLEALEKELPDSEDFPEPR